MKYSELEYYAAGIAMLMQERLGLTGTQKLELIKLRRQLEASFELVQKTRIALCIEYAEKDENGSPKMENNQYIISDDLQAEFNRKLKDLFSSEVELSVKKSSVKIQESDISAKAIEALLLISDSDDIFIS